MKPSVAGLVCGGFISLRSLLANMSKSNRISKFVRSRAVGMKVNALLSISFSATVSSNL